MRWTGLIERMKSAKFVMKMYMSETMGPNGRGRPLGRWKDGVKEYTCEGSGTKWRGFEQARREWLHRETWRIFCFGHPLVEDFLRGSEASKL